MTRPSALSCTLLPVALTLLFFLPSAMTGSFLSDDWAIIANHQHPGGILGEWSHPGHIWAARTEQGFVWRPLTASVHQLIGELLGRSPLPFRLFNVLVHALNAGLVVLCLLRIRPKSPSSPPKTDPTHEPAPTEGRAAWGASGLACLWALFPANPDAVCWASSAGDLLATSALLLATLWGLSARSLLERVLGTSILFLLALLCKESALPFALGIALAALLLRGWRSSLVLGLACGLTGLVHERWHAAVVGERAGAALEQSSLLDILRVWADYLGWPLTGPYRAGFTHLALDSDLRTPLATIAICLLIALLRSRRGLVALLLWGLMLLPAALASLGFGQQASRYVYLPFALFVAFLGALPFHRRSTWLTGGLLLALWGSWSALRVREWQSDLSLFQAEYLHEPENPLAAMGWGRTLCAQQDFTRGLPIWRQAFEQSSVSTFLLDPQQERLDYAAQAAAMGRPDLAWEQLQVFVAQERVAGRPVDPAILIFAQELEDRLRDAPGQQEARPAEAAPASPG